MLAAKNSLIGADARQLENAFQAKVAMLESEAACGDTQPVADTPGRQPASSPSRRAREFLRTPTAAGIDKSRLAGTELRRACDKDHVRFLAKQ